VLDEYTLKYYSSPYEAAPRGAIPLVGAQLYTAVHDQYGARYFELHVPAARLKCVLMYSGLASYRTRYRHAPAHRMPATPRRCHRRHPNRRSSAGSRWWQ
jgi:hypothetical protein